jgi:hypothetical protein
MMKELLGPEALKAIQQREADTKNEKRKTQLLKALVDDINAGIVNRTTVDCLNEYYRYIGHPMEVNAAGLVPESSEALLRGLTRLVRDLGHDITCEDLESFI